MYNIINKIWNLELCTGCVNYEGKEMCICDPIGFVYLTIISIMIIIGIIVLFIIPLFEKHKQRRKTK